MFLKFKQLFRGKDYRKIMEIAKSNQINLSLAKFYLKSITIPSFSIEYDDSDINKANEMLVELDKVTFESID